VLIINVRIRGIDMNNLLGRIQVAANLDMDFRHGNHSQPRTVKFDIIEFFNVKLLLRKTNFFYNLLHNAKLSSHYLSEATLNSFLS
jgi:hypothetical protein